MKNDISKIALNPVQVWFRLHVMYSNSFPKLNHLMKILRVVPMSNAIVELDFSAMAKTKTDWRCSLGKDKKGRIITV